MNDRIRGVKNVTLREKLIVLRDKAGISQLALAHQLGVSRQAVSRWESGSATPSMDKLKALAKIYGVSLDWLCSDASDAGESVQAEKPDSRDLKCKNTLHTEERLKKHNKPGIIAVLLIIGMLLSGYLMLQQAEFSTSEARKIGDLEAENVNDIPESNFEFDWEEE